MLLRASYYRLDAFKRIIGNMEPVRRIKLLSRGYESRDLSIDLNRRCPLTGRCFLENRMERMTRLERASTEWHSGVLAAVRHSHGSGERNPTSVLGFKDPRPSIERHRNKLGWGGQQRSVNLWFQRPVLCQLSYSPKTLAPEEGFEPPVGALTVRCLSSWLLWNN